MADAAFDAVLERVRRDATAAELVEASALIGDAGFTTRDDLVPGFVGRLPPAGAWRHNADDPGGARLRARRGHDDRHIQPNVVTRDQRTGVQTGELVAVTADGTERLHDYERRLLRIC
jgi:Xaa-Pro dipeptidase